MIGTKRRQEGLSQASARAADAYTIAPAIMDIEASGFGPHSYPIEVGVATNRGKRFCRMIKPHEDWQHWDPAAEHLHGISRALLDEKGIAITTVCDALNTLLEGQTLYSDGWVVDYPWLIRLFHAGQRQMRFRLSPLEMILNETQMTHWQRCKQQIADSRQFIRHRASTDAELVQLTYQHTRALAG